MSLPADLDWKSKMDCLCLLAGLLRDEPLDEMLETLDRADTVMPILDPTAYRAGMDNIEHQRELLRALRQVQRVVRKIEAEAAAARESQP